jgi:hypothetical protein
VPDEDDDWPHHDRRAAAADIDPVFIATTFAEMAGQMRMIRLTIQGVKADLERQSKAGYVAYQLLPAVVLEIPEIKALRDDALRREGSHAVYRVIAGGGGVVSILALALSLLVAFHVIK